MTCLENIANPYTTVLGTPESGATRINIARTINGGGWILGATIGGHYVFSGGDGGNANAGLTVPYLGIGIFVSVLLMIFIFSKVPDLRTEDESRKSAEQKTASSLPAASWRASPLPWRWFAGCCISLLPRFCNWSGRC